MMTPRTDKHAVPRRRFVEALAAAGAVGLLRSEPAAAHQDPSPQEKNDPLDAQVDARLALIVARYGARLDDEARQTIREDIRHHIRRAQRLKRVPLENGDGPFPVLVPYRLPVD